MTHSLTRSSLVVALVVMLFVAVAPLEILAQRGGGGGGGGRAGGGGGTAGSAGAGRSGGGSAAAGRPAAPVRGVASGQAGPRAPVNSHVIVAGYPYRYGHRYGYGYGYGYPYGWYAPWYGYGAWGWNFGWGFGWGYPYPYYGGYYYPYASPYGYPYDGSEVEVQAQLRRSPSQGQSSDPAQASETFGMVSLRTQPVDAEILVDGEAWERSSGTSRLVIQLAPGRHRVEIRKPGFATYSEEVLIRAGATLTLNVSLLGGQER